MNMLELTLADTLETNCVSYWHEEMVMTLDSTTVQRSPLLDTYEAAEYLGVPRQTLAVWRTRHKKTGPAYVRMGRWIKYRRDDLDAYIDAQRVTPQRHV